MTVGVDIEVLEKNLWCDDWCVGGQYMGWLVFVLPSKCLKG